MKVNLMKGDCLKRMRDIEDGSVDMVLADPPYGTTACKWDTVIDLERMWAELKRIVKPNGAIVMTASQPFTSVLGASQVGMLKYCWYWRKSRATGHLNAKKMPMKDIEDVLVFYSSTPTYNPQGIVPLGKVQKNSASDMARGVSHLLWQTHKPLWVVSRCGPVEHENIFYVFHGAFLRVQVPRRPRLPPVTRILEILDVRRSERRRERLRRHHHNRPVRLRDPLQLLPHRPEWDNGVPLAGGSSVWRVCYDSVHLHSFGYELTHFLKTVTVY